MPVKGWMNVRALPDTKKLTVTESIELFFKHYDLCDECHGRKFHVNDSKINLLPGTTTVKIAGHSELEKMEKAGNLTSDTVKTIIETIIYNRKQCGKCKGFGFVKKKSGKKKDEKK